MEQAGLTVKDMEPYIGKSNWVYEVLSGKRPLTLSMIHRLNQELRMPAESLIGETVISYPVQARQSYKGPDHPLQD